MAKKKPGPEPLLNDELFKRIKQSILDGNDLRKTAKVCEINEGTFYVWHSDNYLNLADKIEGWRRDRKLMLAERNINEILEMECMVDAMGPFGPIINKKTKKPFQKLHVGILKIKSDTSQFVAETLGKGTYSKRSELTGKNGEQLGVVVLPTRNEDPLATDKETSGSVSED